MKIAMSDPARIRREKREFIGALLRSPSMLAERPHDKFL